MAKRKRKTKARPAKRKKKRGKSRAGKADTVAGAVAAVAEAELEPPDPPAHMPLRKIDLPHWRAIMDAKHPEAWTLVDLEKAVVLARAMADVVALQKRLQREGHIVKTKHGAKMVNPLHNLIETLSKRIVYLSRLLHIHASATRGRGRDDGEKTKQLKKAKKAKAAAAEDPLIAPPVSRDGGDGQALH